jgi:hypothetical protein
VLFVLPDGVGFSFSSVDYATKHNAIQESMDGPEKGP